MSLPEIIAIGGYAYAGKDTTGTALVESYGYSRVAFAESVRDVLLDMDPLIDSGYGPVSLSWVIKDVGWDVAKREYPEVRRLMQRLGGAVRQHVGINAWVTAALRKATTPRVVFTDVRHRNELSSLVQRGAWTLWVHRPGIGPLNNDASENSLSSADFDHVLHNTGTPDDLPAALGELMHDMFGVAPE
ncbi:hypothetical protein [Streptomyces sp. NPDC091027]|uniref:deoxynucleotide monophosphate kinase family protein n=1 Tax=Streptomyces sp. NPDC091027 TaxID=3365971 RepID=UPI003820DB7D